MHLAERERLLREAIEAKSQSALEALQRQHDDLLQRHSQELAKEQRRIVEFEMEVRQTREEGEADVQAVKVRNAKLEGELRMRQGQITEVEGRLEAQRAHVEQLSGSLDAVTAERDAHLSAKEKAEA